MIIICKDFTVKGLSESNDPIEKIIYEKTL